MLKKVTPADIIRAAEENGYHWYRGGWFDHTGENNDFPITAACILGQVCLNLEIDSDGLTKYLFSLPVKTTVGGREVSNVAFITEINDNEFLYGVKTYKALVRVLKRLLKPHMDNSGVEIKIAKRVAIKTTSKSHLLI